MTSSAINSTYRADRNSNGLPVLALAYKLIERIACKSAALVRLGDGLRMQGPWNAVCVDRWVEASNIRRQQMPLAGTGRDSVFCEISNENGRIECSPNWTGSR